MSGCDVRRKVAALAVLAALIAVVPSMAQAGASQPRITLQDDLSGDDPGGADPEPETGDNPLDLPVTIDEVSNILFACDHLDRVVDRVNPSTESGQLLSTPDCDLVGDAPTDAEAPPIRIQTQDRTGAVPVSPAAETSTGTRPGVDVAEPQIQASAADPTPADGTWPPGFTIAALTLAVAGLLAPLVLSSRDDEDNEIRRRIYEMVCDDPAISATAVAEALDIHLTTAIYHLDQLRDADRIEGVEEGRSTLYFENHRKYGRIEKRVLTTLKKGTAADLLELVAENPGIHPAELARKLDLSRTSIKWHTDRLADDGLIEKQPSGATLQLQVPDQAEQLLRKYRPA